MVPIIFIDGPVAQLVERRLCKAEALGSKYSKKNMKIPTGPSFKGIPSKTWNAWTR